MELSFKINKPQDQVFSYLTDMQKFAALHPVITKIVDLHDNNYIVHETLKLGFIPVAFTYPVSIFAYPQDNVIVMRATVMGLTKIDMTFALTSVNGFTVVKENLSIDAPLPFRAILQRVFRKQHAQLFKNIENAAT